MMMAAMNEKDRKKKKKNWMRMVRNKVIIASVPHHSCVKWSRSNPKAQTLYQFN